MTARLNTNADNFPLYYAAIDTEKAWENELFARKIGRWHPSARGEEGSHLRALCDAKCAAATAWLNSMKQEA